MKLTHIDNACCIYENNHGTRLLCDPWLTDGAFEGSWGHYPELLTKPEDVKNVDALYISHLHPDHFDPETLKVFSRSIPIFVLNQKKRPNFLVKKLQDLGFTNLQILADQETVVFKGFELTMYAPFCRHPFEESELGNFIDSALVVKADDQVILNANDNTPTVESALKLRAKHGAFTVAQLKDSLASPYPSCFLNLSATQKRQEADILVKRQMEAMTAVAQALGAHYFQPFAGSYQLVGKLIDKNKDLGICSPSKAIDFINAAKLKPLILREGDSIDLDSNAVLYAEKRSFLSYDLWRTKMKDVKYPYEDDIFPALEPLRQGIYRAISNLQRKQRQYNYFPDLLLTLNTSNVRLSFSMRNDYNKPNNWLECTLDSRLLWRIIERRAHFNNAEVGCHIEFRREPNVYDPDLVNMMSFFHG